MAVDGTWKLTVKTPMGEQQSTLTLSSSGATVTGTQSAATGQSRPIEDGKISGNTLNWKASIERPMPMTLEFSGTIDGDSMTGSVKLGMFGSSTFSGVRA